MDANQALNELLAGRLEPGVYQWRTPPVPGAVGDTSWTERAEEAGWRGFHLDGRRARDKAGFLRLCAAVFEAPALADGDWDDLAAALRDLSWAPAKNGYLVLYESWAELADTDHKSLRMVLDVFGDAVKAWRATSTPMTVLMSSVGVEVAGVPRLA
ncbi:barstar family protein [Actinomadura sp. NAK00032]|uniref:barstar family protein n=1 Tax=Actinomadura sp. NAK00032 TaxID=2742128 RepID=UPI001591B8BF|nr:barstar family protein [Actinomadura sp. NAK00032]QKW40045.1 barstar family protein [Actinomadura sp. NAK00032]